MKNFLLISREINPDKQELIDRIEGYIESRGGSLRVGLSEEKSTYEQLQDIDCIISMGGDGTFIRIAQSCYDAHIPIIGLNKGHLGYLCELDEQNIIPNLERLISEDYVLEHRMMIETDSKDRALNDIVVFRSEGFQIVQLSVYVNGEYLYSYNCDGIVISSPTGSTGYNLSAGGPIVEPTDRALLLTPINAHALSARSIVFSADDEIAIQVEDRLGDGSAKVDVRYDGTLSQSLRSGQRVTVRAASETTDVVILSKLSFLERIREKMQAE